MKGKERDGRGGGGKRMGRRGGGWRGRRGREGAQVEKEGRVSKG